MGEYWVGLISGTSADAVDAALVEIGPSPAELRSLAELSLPIDDALRERIHVASRAPLELRELLRLDLEIGERLADAARDVCAKAGVPLSRLSGIGSHGQTLAHHPEPGVRGSLQVGAPSVVHERTGVPVVADFRRADLAAGGEGAPLTPFLHHIAFATADEPRAVLNIGGFTNLSFLPDDSPARVIAFDPGPGNALIDRAARLRSEGRQRFDADGAWARQGRPDANLLERLLEDPYFGRPPPKSTGHEHFDASWFDRARSAVESEGGSLDDLLATLTSLTVESVVRASETFLPVPPARWIVYGGGVHNSTLMGRLAERLSPTPVETSDAHGVSVDALEAITFALLGWCAAHGRPSNLPSATGARRAVVLGVVTPTRAQAR